MRVLVQRVSCGSVAVEGEVKGAIDRGLVILVGICHQDREEDLVKMAYKVANLRIFSNERGLFAHSLIDVGGGALVVSQFTLYGDCRKGRRPSFTEAAAPEKAAPMIDRFVALLSKEGVKTVETGVFGADMQVSLINDGPVTIWLDSENLSP